MLGIGKNFQPFGTGKHNFGYIPDPPEPLSDKWYESHCPKCKHYREWEDGGKIYGECTNSCCEFEENEDGTD